MFLLCDSKFIESKIWFGGGGPVITPTGALRGRVSAATLARPGEYLNFGENACMVQYQRAIFPLNFLDLNISHTAA